MLTLHKTRKIGPIEVPDTAPLAHGVEEATQRLSSAVEAAGTLTAKNAKKGAKQASEAASALSERLNGAQAELKQARRKRRVLGFLPWRRLPSDAILKAQLAKTSSELSRESTDLNHAVSSLQAVIKANRKAAATGRTRLIGGVAIGAAVMYHLDPAHGKERRKATTQRLRTVAGGAADAAPKF